jgi:hypothetical protein
MRLIWGTAPLIILTVLADDLHQAAIEAHKRIASFYLDQFGTLAGTNESRCAGTLARLAWRLPKGREEALERVLSLVETVTGEPERVDACWTSRTSCPRISTAGWS